MTVAAPKNDLLLDPTFMARLDQLDLISRKLLAGKMKGERRSKRRGQSVEFADYRNYVVGATGGMRRRRRVPRMLDFINKLQPTGPSHLAEACKRFALAHRHKGVCVVLSDFFDKGGYENGLRYVAGGKYDLFAVQTLSPQEIEPDLQGDLKLRDMEDDDMAEVSITQPLLKQYKANLNAYCLGLKDYVTRRGGTYLFTSTAVPFDTLVLNYLRERGLLG